MILDALSQSQRYAGLHPRFASAFAWLEHTALEALPAGRQLLAGDQLTVTVESGMTSASADKRLESHRRYIDIHVNLLGPELMEWSRINDLEIADDFQSDGDIRFYHQPKHPVSRLIVPPRHFAIFWATDAHKPGCSPSAAPIPFRKLVFKVALSS